MPIPIQFIQSLLLGSIVCFVIASIILYARYVYNHPYVKVVGDSMYPTYHDGQYLKSVSVASTMGPGIKLSVAKFA